MLWHFRCRAWIALEPHVLRWPSPWKNCIGKDQGAWRILRRASNKDPKVNLANCRNFAKFFFVVKKIWGESRNDVYIFSFNNQCFIILIFMCRCSKNQTFDIHRNPCTYANWIRNHTGVSSYTLFMFYNTYTPHKPGFHRFHS